MKYLKAILWPANKRIAGDEGDVPLLQKVLTDRKAVYWDNFQARTELEGPFKGYIYVSGGRVEYECDVEKVISRKTLLKDTGEQRFIPVFRLDCLEGKKHPYSNTWIKITKITKLSQPKDLGDFIKLSGGRVERVQGAFVYVEPL